MGKPPHFLFHLFPLASSVCDSFFVGVIIYLDCFHTRAKCAIWIIVWIAHFELSFEWRYFGPYVRQLRRDASFEMRNTSDGPEVFSSYASLKSRSEITVWMPWPLNCDLGGGATWTSNHFCLYTARCICTEAQEMRAPCMFDWQGTLNPNSVSRVYAAWFKYRDYFSRVYTAYFKLRNSNDNSNCALCSRVKTVIGCLKQPYATSISTSTINRLQSLQNSAARLVTITMTIHTLNFFFLQLTNKRVILFDKFLICQVPWEMYGDWLKFVMWLVRRNVKT